MDGAEDEGRGGVGADHLVEEPAGLRVEAGGAEGDGEVGKGVGGRCRRREAGAGPVEEIQQELGVEARGGVAAAAEKGG